MNRWDGLDLLELDECALAKDRRLRDDEEMEEQMQLSIGAKIKQIAGLAHTQDVSESTSDFIDRVCDITDTGRRTSILSEAQIEWIEDIHRKHFGDAQ